MSVGKASGAGRGAAEGAEAPPRYRSEDGFGRSEAPPRGVRTILVATDLAPPAHAAVDVAVGLAAALGARLVIAYVFRVDAMLPGPEANAALVPVRLRALAALQHTLDRAVERHRQSSLLFLEGEPETEILAAAARVTPDLIVVGTHARRGLDRLVHGSTAEQIVRQATVPVLVVPRRSR